MFILKCWQLGNKLHGVTTHKTLILGYHYDNFKSVTLRTSFDFNSYSS